MDKKERVRLIRQANELMNNNEIEQACDIYLACDYSGGILRVADHYMWKLRKPLLALPLYKHINATKKVEDIYERMVWAFKQWWREDDKSSVPKTPPPQEKKYSAPVEKKQPPPEPAPHHPEPAEHGWSTNPVPPKKKPPKNAS